MKSPEFLSGCCAPWKRMRLRRTGKRNPRRQKRDPLLDSETRKSVMAQPFPTVRAKAETITEGALPRVLRHRPEPRENPFGVLVLHYRSFVRTAGWCRDENPLGFRRAFRPAFHPNSFPCSAIRARLA